MKRAMKRTTRRDAEVGRSPSGRPRRQHVGDTASRMQDRNRTETVDVRSLSVRNSHENGSGMFFVEC